MITSFCCAVAAPANKNIAAPAATLKTAPQTRFMLVPSLLYRVGLIGKGPDPKVISNIAPQAVEPLRLDHQEENDQSAEQDQPQIGYRVLQLLLREDQPA